MDDGPTNSAPFRLIFDVEFGNGVTVFSFTNLYGCSIGDETRVGPFVEIQRGAAVGARCKIQSHTFICDGVTIEDEVFVGPCAVFTNDLRPRAQNPDWKITPTLVRRGASIGANATLVCGIEVGEYAMIAAGSVVTKDVQPYQLVAGNPARPRGWVDERGEIVSRETERG